MNKLYSLLLFLYFTSTIQAKPKYGITGEMSLSNIYIDIPFWQEITENHLGFGLGVIGDFQLSTKVNYIPSLMYIQRGTNWSNDRYDLPATKLNFNYLSFTSIFNTKLYKFISLDLGPQLNYLFSATQSLDDGEITDLFKKIDIILCGGISFNINSRFSTSLRYNYGILDINDGTGYQDINSVDEFPVPKVKSRSFSIALSYYFNNGEK